MPYSARPDLCEGRTAMSVPGRDLYWLPSRTQECETEGEAPLDNQRDTFFLCAPSCAARARISLKGRRWLDHLPGARGRGRANLARFSHACNYVRGRRSNCRAGAGCCQKKNGPVVLDAPC